MAKKQCRQHFLKHPTVANSNQSSPGTMCASQSLSRHFEIRGVSISRMVRVESCLDTSPSPNTYSFSSETASFTHSSNPPFHLAHNTHG